MCPPDNIQAAPNLCLIHARVITANRSEQFPDKVELSLKITQSTNLDGPDFTSRYLEKIVAGFTFNPTFEIKQDTLIVANASYIGGPHAGAFHLTELRIQDD